MHLDYSILLASLGHIVFPIVDTRSTYAAAHANHGELLRLRAIGFYDLIAAWRLRRFVSSHKIDVIIAHNARALSLAQLATPAGFPIIYVAHSSKTKRIDGASHYIVLNESMQDAFRVAGVSDSRLSCIPNPCYSVISASALDQGASSSELVLGFIGRFVAEKQIDWLLVAAEAMQNEGHKIHLRLAGDGPLRDDLESEAARRGLGRIVFWDGWVDAPLEWLKRVDLLVLPSRHESFGLVLVEAMASGKLVVCSDADGPASIMQGAPFPQVVFSRNKLDACIAALSWQLAHRETWQQQRMFNRQRAQDFSPESVGQKIASILGSLVP